MLRTLTVGVLIVSLLSLAGCIVVIDDTGEMDAQWASSWEDHDAERAEADRGLANHVKNELEFDELLRHENIEVRAHGDNVSLHGRMSHLEMLRRAVELAASVEGVQTVHSRLTVEYMN